MPRKRKAIERTVLPDPKYNDVILSKFINGVMG
ncbi:MAG: 30S ribosomal protein S7, partial [Prosthecochloris sp.]|nr:30S ribosomal protein S7 [Prosthecochloris sp.]